MNKQKIIAFTLVELIVVITILAILGTIAYLSLQGYSSQSRDSARLSDMGSIKSWLELYQIDAGKYPIPSNGIDITYSGGIVWTQGTFGESVFASLNKLDKIPKDPLSEKLYTYSVTSNKKEFQLGGILESDELGINNNISKTNAGNVSAKAYVVGNYNGQMVKSNSGTICNILSTPSIIVNDTSITDLEQLILNNNLVYEGYNNLPSSFAGSKFKQDGGFSFYSNGLLAYSDNNNCEPIIDKSSNIARILLIKGLQKAYSGTLLKDKGEIKNLISIDIDVITPSSEAINYAGNLVNNKLGGDIDTTKTVSYSTGSRYPGCDADDITIAGQTWSACNVGATISGTGASSYGGMYQRGRNDDIRSGTLVMGVYNGTLTNDSTGNNNYYLGSSTPSFDWFGPEVGSNTPNRWAGGTPKGPCETGYHVPTRDDWQLVCYNIKGSICTVGDVTPLLLENIQNTLLLPFAGRRECFTAGVINYEGTRGRYWSSTPFVNGSDLFYFYSGGIYTTYSSGRERAYGYSVRCIKDN